MVVVDQRSCYPDPCGGNDPFLMSTCFYKWVGENHQLDMAFSTTFRFFSHPLVDCFHLTFVSNRILGGFFFFFRRCDQYEATMEKCLGSVNFSAYMVQIDLSISTESIPWAERLILVLGSFKPNSTCNPNNYP